MPAPTAPTKRKHHKVMHLNSTSSLPLLLLQLLLLLFIATQNIVNINAEPVSSPEIASQKSAKLTSTSNGGGSSSVGNSGSGINQLQQQKQYIQQHQHQQQYQQQQQQQHQQLQQQQKQQQQQQKANYHNIQDAHLNLLSAYATNYDSITNSQPSFKPSYKLPEMETNFTPIQNSGALAAPTPMLMQYVPQSLHSEGGVQYLQLIPTRPLIVPISTFMASGIGGSGAGAGAGGGGGVVPQLDAETYHSPLSNEHAVADYAGRQVALSTLPGSGTVGVNPSAVSGLIDLPGGLPYGLHPYASAMQSYRNTYRINREAKDKYVPPGMSLNMNEYLPGPHDPPRQLYIRGRP